MADDLQGARDNFGQYYLAINPGYEWVGYQQEIIVPALESVERGDTKRLALWMPPGHGKSDIATIAFTTWWLGRNPRETAMTLSYSTELARDFGLKIKKIMQSPLYASLFPDAVLSKDAHAQNRFRTKVGGNYYAVGFGAVLAGRRVKCFPAGTLVATEYGELPIEVVARSGTKVWTVVDGKQCLRRVQYAHVSQADLLLSLRLSNGKTLQCTPGHPIYVEGRGYVAARSIRSGDTFKAYIEAPEILSGLREAAEPENVHERNKALLNGVSHEGSGGRLPLRAMRQDAHAYTRGLTTSWASAFLRTPMFQRLAYSSAGEVSDVWSTQEASRKGLLFDDLRRKRPDQTSEDLPRMPEAPQGEGRSLLARMRGQGTFSENDRRGEQSFQIGQWRLPLSAWLASLRSAIGFGSRRADLPSMPIDEASGGPPHRRAQAQRCSAEPDYSLSPLPQHYAQEREGSVTCAGIEIVGRDGEPVYDLQVEDGHSFFASGVLVHNCMIIDDPVKNWDEAKSERVQKGLFQDYKSIVKTRIVPGGTIILPMTRWAINDIAERIMEDEPDEWEVVRLSAENEDGTFLWEDHYGRDYYLSAKKNKRTWNALYKQRPGADDDEKWFKPEWIVTYDEPIKPKKFASYMICDPALSKSKTGDRTSIAVFVAGDGGKAILVDWVWDRLDPDERTKEIIRLVRKWEPRRFVYEEYGLMADTFHLEKAIKTANLQCYPIPVGRKGPRHMLSKEARIREMTVDFSEGKIVLPEKMEKTLSDGETVDLISQFLTEEYNDYAGEATTAHDDGLDTFSRLHEPELDFRYIDMKPSDDDSDKSYYSGKWKGTWESLW